MKKLFIAVLMLMVLLTTVRADELAVNRQFNLSCSAGLISFSGDNLNFTKQCDFNTTTFNWYQGNSNFSALVNSLDYMATVCGSNQSMTIYDRYQKCILANEEYSQQIYNVSNAFKDQYETCNSSLEQKVNDLSVCYSAKSQAEQNYNDCTTSKSAFINQWWIHVLIGIAIGIAGYMIYKKKKVEANPQSREMYSRT